MTTISFELPDDAVLSMHVPVADISYQLRMAAAVKLYELEQLSSGAAARLAGVPRVAFLAKLGDYVRPGIRARNQNYRQIDMRAPNFLQGFDSVPSWEHHVKQD